jgi:hypothetical protein
MKIFELTDKCGCLYAFEVNNLHLTRLGVRRILRRIPGVTIFEKPRKYRLFADHDEEFCIFNFETIRFVAWEPWNDNSRYWIGPKVDEGKEVLATPQISIIRDYFRNTRAIFGIIWPTIGSSVRRTRCAVR